MKGFFYSSPCHLNNTNLFVRMTKGISEPEIKVLKITVGDVISIYDNYQIVRWKIITNKEEEMYLYYCEKHRYFDNMLSLSSLNRLRMYRKNIAYYIIELNKEQKPILRRIYCKKQAKELIDSMKQKTDSII